MVTRILMQTCFAYPSGPEEELLITNQPLVVFCTCPDLATAESIAETLVNEQLAACVNLLPALTSIYRWQGQVQRDTECLLLIKTHSMVYPQLEARILALHPYQVPEIIALPIQAGSATYLDWIISNLGAPV